MNDEINEVKLDIAEELSRKKQAFNKFYLELVILCALICAVAIVLSVLVYVFAGIAVAMIAVVAYKLLLDRELRRKFGLSYRRVEGGLAVAPIKGGERQDDGTLAISVPDRLMWLDVVELERAQKNPETGISELYLPNSIRKIDKSVIESMTELKSIRFGGTQESFTELLDGELREGVELIFDAGSEEDKCKDKEEK